MDPQSVNNNTTPKPDEQSDLSPAANLARGKLAALYDQEPDAQDEFSEAAEPGKSHSKHQKYMLELGKSGKSLAEIQVAWHAYYQQLPDKEKHEVWQEFYSANKPDDTSPKVIEQTATPQPPSQNNTPAHSPHKKTSHRNKTIDDIKREIKRTVKSDSKIGKSQHVQSALFGLGMGSLVLLVLLFGFFNERFIAPFITPSRSVSSTPIIIDPNNTTAGAGSEVIIPKINVEIPTVYKLPPATTEAQLEANIQKALEGGVVHYPSTPDPGEKGNSVFVGHSSNNIFNTGKYKFAFVLLSKLEKGDVFYLTKKGVRYAYKVVDKKIVDPSQVSVLGNTKYAASATLITCDPPGTSLRRLVVVGEQISPDPIKNKASTAIARETTAPKIVPGNAISLWQRLSNWALSIF